MPLQSHINSFEKGMIKDYNILYQPDGTYRHCVNCSLISQDGNNYVIKDCLGNVKTFSINIRYGTSSNNFDLPGTPIGFISFPDKLIVFSTNDNTETGGYGEIGIIKYLPYGEGIAPLAIVGNDNDGYVPLYHNKNLKFTILQQIEGFAFQENDLIQRVYWTDDLNEPRVFDVGNPIYTTYIPTGSLVVGQQYMVLEGVVTHNGANYGPTIGTGTVVDNVFTAANANYTDITTPTPTAKVIQYVPFQLLSFTPSRSLGNIKFLGYGTGSLFGGAKMYFYRLVSTSQAYTTSWSYGCFPIPVRIGGPGAYFANIGVGTPTTLVNTGKSVQLFIDNIDTNFDRIQIAVAEFDQLVDVPRQISIVIDVPITSTSMTFEHSSNNNIGVLTLSDITLFPASILTCKTMTTNKNYILIGNIRERGEITFNNATVTISQINYPIPAHRNEPDQSVTAFVCPNVQTYVPMDYNPFANPAKIQPYTKFIVTSTAGGSVTYNAVAYTVGQVIVGVPGVFTVTIPAGSQIRPCVSRNRYTTTAGANIPDPLTLSSGYWDYKDASVATHIKGLWNEEKYRYGILFFDLKGNPFYVRHLIDISTTRRNHASPSIDDIAFTESDADGPFLYINQTGVKLSGITISPALIAQISGFSIVRAERDPRVFAQGLLMQSSESTAVVSGGIAVQPTASVSLAADLSLASAPGIYSYLCPDMLVRFPVPNFVSGPSNGAISIEEAFWVTPNNQNSAAGPARYMKSVSGANNESETKYFGINMVDTNPTRVSKIATQLLANENASYNSLSNPSVSFQNKTNIKGGAVAIDTYCLTGMAGTFYTLPAISVAAGGLRPILELVNDTMLDFGAIATTYSDLASGITKMVVNYITDNVNQYGGNSETALAATNYISTGHFQPITNQVLIDTLDVNGNYTFNNVEVWGGDCYTQLVDYGYGLFNDAAFDPTIPANPTTSYSWGIKFPCQSSSNYALRNGTPERKIAPDLMHSNAAGNGIFYKVGVKSQLEGFQYNQGYSSDGHFVAYPSLPINFSISTVFRYRVRFAGQKFPGELINSFRIFLINDYKDIDGQGGEINNLRTKDGHTIIWQNDLISSVPILERIVVSGQSGAVTTLGTGGVVDRFDPVNTYFGNQHQWGLTATEYGFIWFDMRRKAVIVLSLGQGIIEISKAEGLQGFFDEAFLEVIGNTSTINNNILNDPTFSKYSDRPLAGIGVCGVYDPKFKVSYLTFKFIQRNATTAYNKDFTIAYAHVEKQFIGFYDWTPGISWNHNQIVLSANNPKNKLTYFAAGMPSTTFVIGDVVPYLNAEYICYAPVTIASFPGTGSTRPNVIGSSFWRQINQTNQLWVHNQPRLLGQAIAPDYLYDSFFGQVVNNELQYVVNPKSDNPFSVLNMEQEGSAVNFTDLFTSGDRQSASDANISLTTRRNYRTTYDKINSNMPLSSTGRITDSYLLVKWIKHNWTTDPTVVSVAVKILRFVRSLFELKR